MDIGYVAKTLCPMPSAFDKTLKNQAGQKMLASFSQFLPGHIPGSHPLWQSKRKGDLDLFLPENCRRRFAASRKDPLKALLCPQSKCVSGVSD